MQIYHRLQSGVYKGAKLYLCAEEAIVIQIFNTISLQDFFFEGDQDETDKIYFVLLLTNWTFGSLSRGINTLCN